MRKFRQLLLMSVATLVLTACSLGNHEPDFEEFDLTSGISIFVSDEGQVGVSAIRNKNYYVQTEYWLDGEKVEIKDLKAAMPVGASFRTAINLSNHTRTYVKGSDNLITEYQFFRNYVVDYVDKLYYLKDSVTHKLDTLAIGTIHSVSDGGSEVFAGFFGKQAYHAYYGAIMQPVKPFYLEKNKVTVLPMPEKYQYFNGVNGIHKSGDDIYLIGLMDYPMYWKNQSVVSLPTPEENRRGEVSQITTSGDDVYAVGFYTLTSDPSATQIACYWKNGELIKLEDDALANGIYIDSDKNIYIAGAFGVKKGDHTACYWKNGEKVILKKEDDN